MFKFHAQMTRQAVMLSDGSILTARGMVFEDVSEKQAVEMQKRGFVEVKDESENPEGAEPAADKPEAPAQRRRRAEPAAE